MSASGFHPDSPSASRRQDQRKENASRQLQQRSMSSPHMKKNTTPTSSSAKRKEQTMTEQFEQNVTKPLASSALARSKFSSALLQTPAASIRHSMTDRRTTDGQREPNDPVADAKLLLDRTQEEDIPALRSHFSPSEKQLELRDRLERRRHELETCKKELESERTAVKQPELSVSQMKTSKRQAQTLADQRKVLASLQERLSEQARRARQFDGHLPVMDDDRSRDKLVKGYTLFYDEVDIYSQRLEEAFQELSDTIEGQSGRFFVSLLLRAFEYAQQLFNELINEVVRSTQTFTPHAGRTVPKGFEPGLRYLVKEFLSRHDVASCVPNSLLEVMKTTGKSMQLYRLMHAYEKCSPASSQQGGQSSEQRSERSRELRDVMKSFTKKATYLAWQLQLLPASVTAFAREGTIDHTYYTRHSMSDPKRKKIEEVYWPALVDERNVVLCKGIVKT